MTEIFRRNIQVDNVTDALTAIQATLADAGWSTITGSPTSLPLVMGSADLVNSVRVFIRFTNPSVGVLRLNGDELGDASSLSPNRDSTISVGSRLWMSADGDAGVIYLKPTAGNGSAFHFGRFDLELPDDGWAWAVGLLSGDPGTAFSHISRAWNSASKWVADLNQRGIHGNPFTAINFGGVVDPINEVTGRPVIGPYFRIHQVRVFRGVVRFAVTGLAGLPAGVEYESENGDIYVATGICGFRVS